MALATYSDLKTSVGTWLARADLTATIPDFVRLAHSQIMRDLRGHMRLQKRTTITVTGEFVPAPTDFMEFVSGHVDGSTKKLEFVSDDYLTSLYGSGITNPVYFSLVGGGSNDYQFRFLSTGFDAIVQYYARLPFFTADADYNWILTNHPDLYLYGSLLQAQAYIQGDERISLWQQAYAGTLQSIKSEGNRARWGGNSMTIRAD